MKTCGWSIAGCPGRIGRIGFFTRFTNPNLQSIKVGFSAVAASSLDYEINGDFDVALAPKRRALERMIQRVCSEACKSQVCEIPFTRITLHQAKS